MDNKGTLAREHVLPAVAKLSPLPTEEWEHLEGALQWVTLAKGEALTRAGDVAHSFGLVVSGLLRKLHVTEAGRTVVRGFAGAGQWAGAYASLISGEPSNLDVEALVETTMFTLRWSTMQALYERHVCWERLGRRMAESALLEREERAQDLLTLTAPQRYAKFRRTHRALLPLLRSYDIASYLGVTPQSLSRLRARR